MFLEEFIATIKVIPNPSLAPYGVTISIGIFEQI